MYNEGAVNSTMKKYNKKEPKKVDVGDSEGVGVGST